VRRYASDSSISKIKVLDLATRTVRGAGKAGPVGTMGDGFDTHMGRGFRGRVGVTRLHTQLAAAASCDGAWGSFHPAHTYKPHGVQPFWDVGYTHSRHAVIRHVCQSV
jgi:hypothetical protein